MVHELAGDGRTSTPGGAGNTASNPHPSSGGSSNALASAGAAVVATAVGCHVCGSESHAVGGKVVSSRRGEAVRTQTWAKA